MIEKLRGKTLEVYLDSKSQIILWDINYDYIYI